jgi:hypothetical protein
MTGFEWQKFRRGKTGLNGGLVCSCGQTWNTIVPLLSIWRNQANRN